MKHLLHSATLALLLALFPFSLSAKVVGSGSCGSYLTWSYDDETHELRIEGRGSMWNYSSPSKAPWYSSYNILKLSLPSELASIGNNAFSYCFGLTSVNIPNSVTSIGAGAFYNCSGLTSVTIPNSVTSIGDDAFFYCSGLTSVTIPNSVTSIGNSTFSNCSGLTSVTIPNSVISIGDDAFSSCSSLTSVTIPNSVTSIGNYAFSYCSSLTSVTIPNSVTSIGWYAFWNCSGLTSVTIPSSVDNIGRSAFSGVYMQQEKVTNNSTCELSDITICDSEQEDGLLTKDNVAVRCRPWATSVTIPNSVINIGDEAFSNCSSLTSVTIPNSVTSIGNRAFSNCSSLTSVTIPNSVTSIGNSTFSGCSGLTSVTIPSSVDNIGRSAFSGVYMQQEKVTNNSTCELSGITICDSEQEDGLLTKDNVAVTCRPWATSVTIGNSVTRIGEHAFSYCRGLTSVTIPNSVTSIGDRAFEGCRGLTSVTIPNSVTNIGNYTFMFCRGLTSVTIPNSVTSIENGVFYECSGLTSVTIPNSVTSIGEDVFEYCSGLTNVYCLAKTIPSTFSATFENVNLTKVTLHVPEASLSAYKTTSPWSNFGIIKALANPSFKLVDGEPYTNTRRKTYDAVTFSKTFASGAVNKWNALYVPISIDVAASNGEYDIAEIYAFCATVDTNGDGTVDANDERFLFVRPLTAGRTYPNTPYLIRPREAKTYTINSADNILYEKRDGKVEFSTTRDKFVVTGLNESFTVVAGDNNYYVTGTGGLSFRTSGSTTVKPNRWVMHREDREYSDIPDYVEDSNHLDNDDNGESGVKGYRIIAIGEDISEADAIMAVKKANGVFTSGMYTLDGRKVNEGNSLPTGVYIKDGKKYVVK